MAEFTEVMRQRKRMCDNSTCNICDLSSYRNKYEDVCEYFTVHHYEEAEKIIMDWANDNPEPQYPTWREWQENVFGDSIDPIRPCYFISPKVLECSKHKCDDCRNKSIPAEIAEKLGVKLKGVKLCD